MYNSLTIYKTTAPVSASAVFGDANISFNTPMICNADFTASNVYNKTDIDNLLAKKQNSLSFDGTFSTTTVLNINGTSTINVGLNIQYMNNNYYTKNQTDTLFTQTISAINGSLLSDYLTSYNAVLNYQTKKQLI